ncbi:MAG: hypothetical protein LBB22_03035 [Treponema sp.]|jgi:hypothetical protein|nr:hypothetical protein [Treponema sp.]
MKILSGDGGGGDDIFLGAEFGHTREKQQPVVPAFDAAKFFVFIDIC